MVRAEAGFSLIEMLVVLLVASILLLVALPGWRGAVLHSSRAAGRGALLEVMSRQEQYFINNKRYATSLDALGLHSPYYVNRQAEATDRAGAAYRIELDILSSTYIGLRAIPRNGQAADSGCMTLSLSRTGVRSVTGSFAANPARCW